MTTVKVDINNFQSEVLESAAPVVVDFWANWCDPCKMIAPSLEEISVEMEDKIKVAKLNIDENPELASQMSVRSIPALAIFKGGEVAGGTGRRTHLGRMRTHLPRKGIQRSLGTARATSTVRATAQGRCGRGLEAGSLVAFFERCFNVDGEDPVRRYRLSEFDRSDRHHVAGRAHDDDADVGAFAEFERAMLRERTKYGLDAARWPHWWAPPQAQGAPRAGNREFGAHGPKAGRFKASYRAGCWQAD